MLTSLTIAGFRSIREQTVELAPLTVLYGPTASGKSSLLYAPLVLRNLVSNPNEPVDSFFALGFVNLGGFEECVFNHQKEGEIRIAYSTADGKYGVVLRRTSGELQLKTGDGVHLEIQVTFPYAVNQYVSQMVNQFQVSWNGITCDVYVDSAQIQQQAKDLAIRANGVVNYTRKIDIVPHRRGFFKPYYSPVPVTPFPTSEDELATLVINDPYLALRISVDLEEIVGRDFRLYVPPGSGFTYLQTADKQARVPINLANDGFGVNQLVYMLAKIRRSDISTVLMEEPEVHLHPSVMRRFARRLCRIVSEEGKQVLLTTHSEVFVGAVLAAVARREIPAESVRFYLVEKEGKETVFRHQAVTEAGQIEGGMKTFIEGELEDIRALLGM